MSCFVCTACGARFEGRLWEAADAAFAHTFAHARPAAQNPEAAAPAKPLETLGENLRSVLPTESSLWAGGESAR